MKMFRNATLAVALAIAAPAAAQTLTCNQFGAMQTCRGPNGYSSTGNQFGPDLTTGRDSLGNTWTTNRFGDFSTTTVQPGFRQRGW